MRRFRDRRDAGQRLGEALRVKLPLSEGLVLALPRGGVPVGFEVARILGLELDILLVRKLGVPAQEELAMGAIASGGHQVLNHEIIQMLNITAEDIAVVADVERQELARREAQYRGDAPRPEISGRDVILVDDGLATGATMRVAAAAVKAEHPRRVVIAAPAGAPDVCSHLKELADDVVCVITPQPYYGVGRWYDRFEQVTDQEVRQLLKRAPTRAAPEHPVIYPPA